MSTDDQLTVCLDVFMHTQIFTYMQIQILCVCVCVCMWVGGRGRA